MEKEWKELKIDEELRDLLPPLSEDEFKTLEEQIKKEGCRDAIIIWNGFIVDGHNRYNICTKHKFGFHTITLAYDTKDEIIQWMIENQLGRRNLTPLQRIAITEKYRPIFVKMAQENKQLAGKLYGENHSKEEVMLKSAKPLEKVNTRDALAKMANIGHDSYNKGKKVLESGNKEIIQKTMKDEISINNAYNQLFGKKKDTEDKKDMEVNEKDDSLNEKEIIKENNKTKICISCNQTKQLEEFYTGHDKCKECEINEKEKPKVTNSKTEVFKDNNGIALAIDNELYDNEKTENIHKDVKTAKDYLEYVNLDNELTVTEELCEDLIWQLDSKYFTLHNISNKMTSEQIDSVNEILKIHVKSINNIINKLNESKEV